MRSTITTLRKSVTVPATAALCATAALTVLLLTDVIELDPFGEVLLIGSVGGFIWRQRRAVLSVPLMSLVSLAVWAVFLHAPAKGAPESSEPFTPIMVLLLSGMLFMLMAWGVVAGYALGRLLWPPPVEH